MSSDNNSNQRRQIPESSYRALSWIAEQLRAGLSGTIEIECADGGVRELRIKLAFDGKAIGNLTRSNRQITFWKDAVEKSEP